MLKLSDVEEDSVVERPPLPLRLLKRRL